MHNCKFKPRLRQGEERTRYDERKLEPHLPINQHPVEEFGNMESKFMVMGLWTSCRYDRPVLQFLKERRIEGFMCRHTGKLRPNSQVHTRFVFGIKNVDNLFLRLLTQFIADRKQSHKERRRASFGLWPVRDDPVERRILDEELRLEYLRERLGGSSADLQATCVVGHCYAWLVRVHIPYVHFNIVTKRQAIHRQ